SLFDRERVVVGESGSARKLGVDTSVTHIHTVIDTVFHAHRVGGTLLTVTFITHTLGNLNTGHIHRRNAEGRVDRYRTANTNRYSITALLGPFVREDLAKRPYIEPLCAC